MSRYDAVLSYHTNPATCGVAKFNQLLAQKLGVPCIPTGTRRMFWHPLISIKPSEMIDADPYHTMFGTWGGYDLLLHDRTGRGDLIRDAERVFYADELGCPSTLQGNPTRGAINVLTFGMAHKLQIPQYAKLKALLDQTGEDYTVAVSTAVHEGSPWDETALVAGRLRDVFGDRLRVLGYLADDALARELTECSAVALFFDPALRANNTTFWAAIESGRPVVTNFDSDSPTGTDAYDIDAMTEWPTWMHAGRMPYQYAWPSLLEKLNA